MFITWTNQKIKNTFVERNMFEFKHIKPFDRSYADNPGAMVVFATPGMLHAGLSLQLFTKWCNNDVNMVIMPGYCVAGTVGAKVLSGAKKIEVEGGKFLDVKMGVEYMSFSAHADAKGIMQLIQYCEPKNVMLVHGEAGKMEFLKEKIRSEFNLPCFNPANGETALIPVVHNIPAEVSVHLLKREAVEFSSSGGLPKRPRLLHGTLIMSHGKLRILRPEDALKELGLSEHNIRFTSSVSIKVPGTLPQVSDKLYQLIKSKIQDDGSLQYLSDGSISIDSVLLKVNAIDADGETVESSHCVPGPSTSEVDGAAAKVDSAKSPMKKVIVSWTYQDEDLGSFLLNMLKNQFQ
jgi:integrator complex subunit 11